MNPLRLLWICLLCLVSVSYADTPLPQTQAFVFNTDFKNSQEMIARWVIAPGYYLYKNRLSFQILSPKTATLAPIQYPPGTPTEDSIFGKYEVYYNQLTIPLQIHHRDTAPIKLQINYQGCSEGGFCYPPSTQIVYADFSNQRLTMQHALRTSDQDHIHQLLAQKNALLSFFIFMGFGLLLTFTPCVLPMLPILSGIILGQRDLKFRHAFGLSSAYVFGMALTFAIAGVVAAYIGSSVQTMFQKPWIIVLFSGFFVLLAFSLFGFYNIQIPQTFQQRIFNWSRQQTSGSYLGVTVMGVLSTLIVSPCVTPPLIGALSYISKTGNMWIGGVSLFAMGLGMGIPLLLLGTIGGSLLPKAGAWMNIIKNFFGILLLGVALWMLVRILPAQITNPLQIHTFSSYSKPMTSSELFKRIYSLEDLQRELINAKRKEKRVMLDFYADWCIACKIMERTTFSDKNVQDALKDYILLQVDVTKNDEDQKMLMRHFNVIAPPSILFFDQHGKEIPTARIVGEKDSTSFIQQIQHP